MDFYFIVKVIYLDIAVWWCHPAIITIIKYLSKIEHTGNVILHSKAVHLLIYSILVLM